jgi:hypothetical protein
VPEVRFILASLPGAASRQGEQYMKAIQSIINSAGYSSVAEMDLSDDIEVSVDGFMDLTITKI